MAAKERVVLEIIEGGQWDEILDERVALLRAFSQAHCGELSKRSDGSAESALYCLYTGDEGGGDGAEAGHQYSELALRRRDVDLIFC